MGERRLFRRFRAWLALDVMLPVLYAVLGERPMFCDMARDCPLERLERENAQLRNALADALSAMRAWGADEDGIPGDFGAWKAYCAGATLLGCDVDASDMAVEGADDE